MLSPYGYLPVDLPLILGKNSFLPITTEVSKVETEKIAKLIEGKKKPLILIDDPYLKVKDAKQLLLQLADKLTCPILQVNYTRGPMLFEQVQSDQNPYFAGLYNPSSVEHIHLMEKADILITLNDRNAYERVVGKLPSCQKIAITTNSGMTKKNNYLKENDIVIQGDISKVLLDLIGLLADRKDKLNIKKKCASIRKSIEIEYSINPKYSYLRGQLAKDFAYAFEQVKQPVLVDDSQMFGGVLAKNYSLFPHKLRVFGDHGAFVGGGLSLATGIARCNSSVMVFCTLGDQAFTNAIQGLVSSIQENVHIIYIVCNNGKSVSLLKQMKSQDPGAFTNGEHPFLRNPPIQYHTLAKSLGLSTFYLDEKALKNGEMQRALLQGINNKGPILIEFVAPEDDDAWVGVWATKGNEK